MSSDWKEYVLSDVYEFASGLSKNSKEFGFGSPFLSFKTVFYNYFIPSKLNELANTTQVEQEKCSIKKGDVFLTRTSETVNELGMSCVALKDYPHATFNGFTKRLRPKEKDIVYPLFAGYYFRSTFFRNAINSMAIMTTRASLNNEILSKLPILLPSYETQEKIGKILFNIDKKIELNNRMNQTLEKIGLAIFRQWFIHFEFPNENGKPYKSSDGEMVDSELGEIPVGWEEGTLKDILHSIESGTRPKGGIKELSEGIPSIGAENIKGLGNFDYSKNKLISKEFFLNMKNGVVKDKDVLLYKDGANIGRKSLFMENYPFKDCCVNEHVFVLRTNNKSNPFYLYFWLDQPWMTEEIKNLNANTAQPGINKKSVNTLIMLIPNKNILTKFNRVVDPLMSRLFLNSLENKKLSQIRNTLLPKLISGKIRVNITEEATSI